MANASNVQTSFLGGEWSPSSQGGHDRPEYRTALKLCRNGLPMENRVWVRRPGFGHAGTTRNGAKGRLLPFAFQQNAPYNMEFTDGFLRFWAGRARVTTLDQTSVNGISTANPAVVETFSPHGWSTGNQIFFSNLDLVSPLLQNRVFAITVVDTTHFSISDPLTGATIDGSTLGFTAAAGVVTVSRVLDIATPYINGVWSTLRSVQTEKKSFLLNSAYQPRVLSVTSLPTPTSPASFSLDPINFVDGPYYDPVNSLRGTADSTTGLVGLTLSFDAYDATRAYSKNDAVTSNGISYQSLQDLNLNNTPASSPTWWKIISPSQAVGPNGFVGTDIGRLIRLGNSSNQWSWGRIAALGGGSAIPGNIAGVVHIGNMTRGGNQNAAFDGVISKASTACVTGTSPNDDKGWIQSVGQDYSVPGAQQIKSAVVYPSNDKGWSTGQRGGASATITLYGSNTNPNINTDYFVPPAGAVALGSVSVPVPQPPTDFSPVTIPSNDLVTAYKYVWVSITGLNTGVNTVQYVASVQFFGPTADPGSGVTIQLLGTALQSTAITNIRLGLYSDTTGWPTCGTYHEGRLWLSGSVPNRIDGCYSNGISDTTASVNFAPTDATGAVGAANAISYTFNAPSANPIFWMRPHAQGIICGTLKGEWLVQATAANQILTPTSMQAHEVTTIGSYNVEPASAEHTIVFIQKYRRKLQEYFADVFSGKFASPNIAKDAKHFTSPMLQELVFQQELAPILWSRTAKGELLGCTYKRDSLMSSQGPTFAGWHKHPLGKGTPLDRAVESVCVGPSADGTLDSLAIISNDPSSNIRHVEVLTTIMDDEDILPNAWFLDDAIVPSSATQITLADGRKGIRFHGLRHLNDKVVTAFIGGLDCGDQLLKNGHLDVAYQSDPDQLLTWDYLQNLRTSGQSFAYGVSIDDDINLTPVVIGLNYTSQLQRLNDVTNAPELGSAGAQNGPAFGKKRRIHKYAAKIVAAVRAKVGINFTPTGEPTGTLRPMKFVTDGAKPWPAGTLFAGMTYDTVDGPDGLLAELAVQIDRPYPFTLSAIGNFVETKDQ